MGRSGIWLEPTPSTKVALFCTRKRSNAGLDAQKASHGDRRTTRSRTRNDRFRGLWVLWRFIANYLAIWFHSSVPTVANAGTSAASPTSPSHTNPPPPANPPSVKNVNGNPYGKKQSAHQTGRRQFAMLTTRRIEAAAMTHHWNLIRVVSPPMLPARISNCGRQIPWLPGPRR